MKNGEPCDHPECLNHITHPCEGCGRIGGRKMERGEHKTLTYKEFEELASVTESPYFHTDRMKISTIHGLIGIQTEATELLQCAEQTLFGTKALDQENFKEELGDMLWYISAVSRAEGWFMHTDVGDVKRNGNWVRFLMNIQLIAGNLTDYVKKSLFYGVTIDVIRIRNNIDTLYHNIHCLCLIFDWNIEEIMAETINKLKKRYPEQFTTYHSVARLDKE